MALPPYSALDVLQRGTGSRQDFLLVVHYTVFSAALCEAGFEREGAPELQRGQELLHRFSQAGEAANWVFDEDTYRSVCGVLRVFCRQLEQTGPQDLENAYRRMSARQVARKQVIESLKEAA